MKAAWNNVNGTYIKLLYLIFSVLIVTACTTGLQGDTYSKEDARKVQRVKYAVVEDVRMVVIEGDQSALGKLGGAAIGGIAGSSVGGGKGQDIATIAGAIAGGVLGSKAEEAATRKQGIELVLRLESNDQIIAIVQEHNPAEIFEKGDRVRLMTVNGVTRVAQ
jgi:outer membrane lipoprotein SlyB